MGGAGVEVRELSDNLVGELDSYLRRDPVSNFYPLYDLHDEEARGRTSWYVGLRGGRVTGFLLIYRGATPPSIVVGGDRLTASRLLDLVGEGRAVFLVDPDLKEVVKSVFPTGGEYEVEIMALERGRERPCIRHSVELLSENHAPELLKLLCERRPQLRSAEGAERVRGALRRRRVYGVFAEGELASVAQLVEHPLLPVCWITGVFTSERYRGRGFATSAVSKAVEDAFRRGNVRYAGLMVRSDNAPAKRVYEKIGFRKHKEKSWLNLNTDIVP